MEDKDIELEMVNKEKEKLAEQNKKLREQADKVPGLEEEVARLKDKLAAQKRDSDVSIFVSIDQDRCHEPTLSGL